jgi:hypothetical protein
MSKLQQITNRLDFLLTREKATPADLRNLERQLQEANMVGELRTKDGPGDFCAEIKEALKQLTPWAIETLQRPLEMYETAQDLVDAIIPSDHHLD